MILVIPDGVRVDSIHVKAVGATRGEWTRVTEYAAPTEGPPILRTDRPTALPDFVEQQGDWAVVAQGTWDVQNSLSLPEGVGLRIPGGTELRFGRDAALVVRGPTRFEGTVERPVILRGQPTDLGEADWMGVFLFNRNEEAIWSHVRVHNTRGIDVPGWRPTGGVTVYEGRVTIRGAHFAGNRAEDALNLIHTEFTLEDVTVEDAISDGIDIDFGAGRISGARFQGIGLAGGGDAIDLSGAGVVLTDSEFEGIGDKAISVGERSSIVISGLRITGAGAGMVSKDGSYVSVEGAEMSEIRHAALMAYIKKSEYGGAVLEARGVRIFESERSAQVQLRSLLTLNGKRVRGERINVDSLYLTSMRRAVR